MKKVRNFFRKPLDKLSKMCYNLNVIKDRFKSLKPKGNDTMADKKMTKRDYFNALLAIEAVSADETLVTFINHELDLLAKKNSAEKKPTAVQTANNGIKEAILDGMEDGKMYTITDLIKEIDACAELTNQRVSALVRQMIEDGKVERIEEKRKAYFRKVEA